jgi:hypothetical protein
MELLGERLAKKNKGSEPDYRQAISLNYGEAWIVSTPTSRDRYHRSPTARRRGEVRARFDCICHRRTGFATLDRLLERLHANKSELLRVLNRPDIPLNPNGSERDIRAHVIKRKISGGTRSDAGRQCRDAFLGLAKTCAKLGLAF